MYCNKERAVAKPRRTRGKLNAEAQGELGASRVCVKCGDTKVVSFTTFTPKNGTEGLRGWQKTCRVCQGMAASEKRKNLEVILERSGVALADKIQMMYNLDMTGKHSEAEFLGKELLERVRELHTQGRPLDSLEMFIEIVKPLISGWMEPGAIHGDIKNGLVSNHRRRLIIATRYSAKSTLTGIYIAWRIALDPLIKIMVVLRIN